MIVALYHVDTHQFGDIYRDVPLESIEVINQDSSGFLIHFCYKGGDRCISVINNNCLVLDDCDIQIGDPYESYRSLNQIDQYKVRDQTTEIQDLRKQLRALQAEFQRLKNNN